MKKRFVKYVLLFFIPVILGYLLAEYLALNIPAGFQQRSEYLEANNEQIALLILGSSQMKDAVNPAWLTKPAINLASGDQHHDTDLKILKGLHPKLPRLKTVVFEVSYSHFELPHNGSDFWKNSVYLKYFDINCFERPTYFKDRLIFLSNPSFFSKKIVNHYFNETVPEAGFNNFGFDTLNYAGQFKTLFYDPSLIAQVKRFKINTQPDLVTFRKNTALFFNFLDYLEQNNLNVIICKAPMYKTYLPARNPEILKRRDSILQLVRDRYPTFQFLDAEEDTLQFNATHYWNQSHLNPDGAKIFTRMLQKKINQIP